ncbi:D-alanyl-D-alanine carboxypeptidase / D-alanyl-D-alanine-endopeptidase (penicillin-binding protein 4) [Cyclobacterium xiamenense]|uniref:D-alanyl-D-alanine carboxypeptidase / D-alanyl-D-alanine-endopeptidase (Penicillin-binding protein 4) n=1 Tax=Cyclobacterium xiamenense TaxID=1297121 RepID=A0A1H6Y4E9_9BACT|nr:D-alanyl-D-alanine carboxypeptidase [Cyclobacterium xiamenense]SEJ36111.1 D-alanyl-D-alanine carboxypeptidase / D-alanyl-D-alanine-endopeptidase (penicillin-binding protein 4) [Cyclobacterium xiamenense]
MQKTALLGFVFVCFFWFSTSAQDAKSAYLGLDELLGEGSFFDNHLTGFMLYDLDSQLVRYDKNSHLYFIPASTTKLFTFFGSLMVLGDSTTFLRFILKDDKPIVWGTGDPSWKYPPLPSPKLKAFLASYDTLYFSDSNWKDEPFGYGWQWDDYNQSYSAERSPLPLFGNLAKGSNVNNRPVISPPGFSIATSQKPLRNLQRDWHSNLFYYNPRTYNGRDVRVPFITSPETFADLATNDWGVQVLLSDEKLPPDHFVLKGIPTQALYKEMLLESDNFIAEQLLLQISDEVFRELSSEKAIEYIKETYLYDLPDDPQWVDGSGLSRHNLFTPRTMVSLLEKIYRLFPDEELFRLLPTGGRTGTLKYNYSASVPYVMAKTGTISNNHSLVGFLKTRGGKVYAFAFMNNNYPDKSSAVRNEIEKVLLYIRDNF